MFEQIEHNQIKFELNVQRLCCISKFFYLSNLNKQQNSFL